MLPHLLLALLSVVLEGPSIKAQSHECSKQAALSITQLMKHKSAKHMRQHTESTRAVQHKSAQESPLPIYIGLMLHYKLE